jgi:deoxyribodipyrimidine photo-lyase
MWFRRDLRLADNPALLAAADSGPDGVVPLFVFDDRLWGPAGEPRRGYLLDSLADLGARVGGMQLRSGDPVEEVVATARAAGAGVVHVSADFNPYGRRRDDAVERALAGAGLELRRSGSPYAVAPGRIGRSDERSGETQGYQVFSPFFRAWTAHGWPAPAAEPADVAWIRPLPNAAVPTVAADLRLPPAGEAAALARWHAFRDGPLAAYADRRDVPGVDATSRLSVHLKWGEIHPRTLLADLAQHPGPGADTFRSELAWREFYADVLWRRPETARDYLRPQFAALPYAEPDGAAFDAWRDGRTGYPIVDAAMRQLRQEHWMHNRARMIVASFLVKDLHIEWQHGARHFMGYLMDGDLASNQHGWQWTAGSGTDPAPFFRVFNPTTQGKKFDPQGRYVRRFVAELADVPDDFVHEPWRLAGGPPRGYPAPIVDHAEERKEALRRYELIR